MNSMKHGLTSNQIIIPGEDVNEWVRFLEGYFEVFQPVGVSEDDVVTLIAADSWRLRRVPGVESSSLRRAMGHLSTGADDDDGRHEADALGDAFFQLDEHGFLTRKLPRYARDLIRQRKANIAMLDDLQRRRRQREAVAKQKETAATLVEYAVPSAPESDD